MTEGEKQLINEARETLMFCYNLRYRDDFFYLDYSNKKEIDGYYFTISREELYIRKPDLSVIIRIYWNNELFNRYEIVNHLQIFMEGHQITSINLDEESNSNINMVLYETFKKSPEVIYLILRMKQLTLLSLSDDPRVNEYIRRAQDTVDKLNSWKNFINNSLKDTTNG